MLRRAVCVVLVVLGLVAGAWAVPATAAGTGVPVFVSPTDGSQVQEWDGSWSIDFSGAPVGSYTVAVIENGYVQSSYPVTTTADTGVVTQDHYDDTRLHQGTVTLRVTKTDDPNVAASATFGVLGYDDPKLLLPTFTDYGPPVYNWDGRVRLDFTGARPGTWEVDVRANGWDYQHTEYVTYDGVNPVRDVWFPTYDYTGRFRIDVGFNGPSSYWDTWEFDNVDTATLSEASVSADAFYPTVRDGFKDAVDVGFRVDRKAKVRMTVLDADLRPVYRDSRDVRRAGRYAMRWNGQTRSGWAKPGRYRIELSTGPSGATSTVATHVRVVTDYVTDRKTLVRRGTQTSSRSVHGPCRLFGYSGELTLDCWGFFGAASAEARYGFRLPASATNLHWAVRGTVGCCDTGVIDRGMRQTSATNAYVYVHVTRSRAYTVRRVELGYAYQRKR